MKHLVFCAVCLLGAGCLGDASPEQAEVSGEASPKPVERPALECGISPFGQDLYVVTSAYLYNDWSDRAVFMCVAKFLQDHPADEVTAFVYGENAGFYFATRPKAQACPPEK